MTENLSAMARGPRQCCPASYQVRERKFQFLLQNSSRNQGAKPALEALCPLHQWRFGRSGRTEICRTHLRRGRQRPHFKNGAGAGKSFGRGHSEPFLDESRNQETSGG